MRVTLKEFIQNWHQPSNIYNPPVKGINPLEQQDTEKLKQPESIDGEIETRYHSFSPLDKIRINMKNRGLIRSFDKDPRSELLKPENRGVPVDSSKEWIKSMAGAKTVNNNSQYGNYGSQYGTTPFMQISMSGNPLTYTSQTAPKNSV
jgi:hypothetical protein